MKRLFENGTWGPQEIAISTSFDSVIRPVYEMWVEKGYSVQDLSHMITGVAQELEVDSVMDLVMEKEENYGGNTPIVPEGSAMLCEHANENPNICKCPPNCYCRTRTCRNKRVEPGNCQRC